MSKNKKTLVFGASRRQVRYSYKAVVMLQEYNHDIEAVGGREGNINGVPIQVGQPILEDIHTITMYMGEDRQKEHEEYLLSLNPKRIVFNPGAENMSFFFAAKKQGIEVVNACTLVMLRTDQY